MKQNHHKLYHYEVTPPAGCWERIASELDAADMDLSYPSTLRDIAVTPPESVWQNISESLNKGNKKPFFVPFLRYAAAAAIIGILAWGGMRLLNHNEKGQTPEVAANPVPNKPASNNLPAITRDSVTPPVIETDEDLAIADAIDNAALEQSKRTYASLDVPSRSKIRNVSSFYFVPDEIPDGGTRGIDYAPDYTDIPEEPVSNRYIMLMTPEGNIIRMSRKLGDLVCCVSGEEQDDDCIEQMKKWREQLASPNHGHAAGSFMDILGLLKSMQENSL